jgi:hypothetical protein
MMDIDPDDALEDAVNTAGCKIHGVKITACSSCLAYYTWRLRTEMQAGWKAENTQLRKEIEELKTFARDIFMNYDCDSDSHKYGLPCRACAAEKLLGKLERVK